MSEDLITPAPARSSPRSAHDEATRQLIVFASCVRRSDDELAVTLQRIQAHNRTVTEVLAAASATPRPKIVKYVGDGALIFFGAQQAGAALYCAARIIAELRGIAKPPGGGTILSRVGLSAGDVNQDGYDADTARPAGDAACDHLGVPIEIATRLVADIAKPGQIVLDEAAWKTVGDDDLALLRKDWPGAALLPKGGEELCIQGVPDSIPVYELVWVDGYPEPLIQNRRLLADELIDLLHKVTDLCFRLREDPPKFDKLDDVQRFGGFVTGLKRGTGRDREIKALADAWKATREARKLDELPGLVADVLAKFEALVEVWQDSKRDILRDTHESQIPIGDCLNAYGDLDSQAKFLYYEILETQKRLGESF